jgi:hypothetical protein
VSVDSVVSKRQHVLLTITYIHMTLQSMPSVDGSNCITIFDRFFLLSVRS